MTSGKRALLFTSPHHLNHSTNAHHHHGNRHLSLLLSLSVFHCLIEKASRFDNGGSCIDHLVAFVDHIRPALWLGLEALLVMIDEVGKRGCGRGSSLMTFDLRSLTREQARK